MKLTIVKSKKVRSSSVSSLAKPLSCLASMIGSDALRTGFPSEKVRQDKPDRSEPLPWRIDENPENSRLLAQWQSVDGKLQCRWFLD
ncbi:hypothetical protein [Chamaesiphon sp. OTE_20_metabat_361]|uniref:hypothetical protein n=1 Tax=Chamaesiphon sp. OTE_20_metabat_361 TaxID=2964689 RepID=UPI00286C7D80|nr:hypothetical protein [Chamaesiphon sp. OTE_20_metabat_361]